MERRVTGAFAQVLAAGRERFNAAFTAARRTNRNLDGDRFLAHLAERVMPVVNLAAAAAPEQAMDIGAALFHISLDLFAAGCFGTQSRATLMDQAWRRILPAIPGLIAADPRGIAAAVSNAAYNLAAEKSADGQGWLQRMQAIGAHLTDAAVLRKAGVIAAWRCGLAHFREGALSACENVPLSILRTIFNMEGVKDDAQVLKRLRQLADDPWSTADADMAPSAGQELAIVRICGGFRGFGGAFIQPPVVRLVNGRFMAYDGEFQWRLDADAYGAVLHRLNQAEPLGGFTGSQIFRIDLKGKVTHGTVQAVFPELLGSLSQAATETTLAVTLPHSHKIFLIARVPAEKAGRKEPA